MFIMFALRERRSTEGPHSFQSRLRITPTTKIVQDTTLLRWFILVAFILLDLKPPYHQRAQKIRPQTVLEIMDRVDFD
jgi:hypothetical protein